MGYKKVKKTRTAYRTEIRGGVAVEVPYVETYEANEYVSDFSYSDSGSANYSDSSSSGGSSD